VSLTPFDKYARFLFTIVRKKIPETSDGETNEIERSYKDLEDLMSGATAAVNFLHGLQTISSVPSSLPTFNNAHNQSLSI